MVHGPWLFVSQVITLQATSQRGRGRVGRAAASAAAEAEAYCRKNINCCVLHTTHCAVSSNRCRGANTIGAKEIKIEACNMAHYKSVHVIMFRHSIWTGSPKLRQTPVARSEPSHHSRRRHRLSSGRCRKRHEPRKLLGA